MIVWINGAFGVGKTRTVLARLDADPAIQPVIVPMTLVVDEYADEILNGLRNRGTDLRHVSLRASPDTVRRRLRPAAVATRGPRSRSSGARRRSPGPASPGTSPPTTWASATSSRTSRGTSAWSSGHPGAAGPSYGASARDAGTSEIRITGISGPSSDVTRPTTVAPCRS